MIESVTDCWSLIFAALVSLSGMVETPRLQEKKSIHTVAMRLYKLGAHTKTDLNVHLIWIPKYRKRVLTGPVAIRMRGIPRQSALERKIELIKGKVSSEHVHMFVG